MAPAILFTLSLCALICAVLTLPVHDIKSVKTESREDLKTDKTEVLEVVAQALGKDSASDLDPVPSLDSELSLEDDVPVEDSVVLKRTKRQVIVSYGCPSGMIYFAKKCMPFEQYERLLKAEAEE